MRVETGGGFVPVEYNLTATPEFSLYGDGRVIETGPMILIYPGPALPNLQTAVISEEAIQGILEAAREAGLFDPTIDYGQPGITDVGTTTFTINADGQTYRTDIYALGMEEGAGGLTMEQQQARAAVSDFRAKLMDLTAFETEEIVWEPFEYEALDVYSRAVDPAASPDPADVQPNRLVWPLDDLATAGAAVQPEGYRRVTVTGDDLATLGRCSTRRPRSPYGRAQARTTTCPSGRCCPTKRPRDADGALRPRHVRRATDRGYLAAAGFAPAARRFSPWTLVAVDDADDAIVSFLGISAAVVVAGGDIEGAVGTLGDGAQPSELPVEQHALLGYGREVFRLSGDERA